MTGIFLNMGFFKGNFCTRSEVTECVINTKNIMFQVEL